MQHFGTLAHTSGNAFPFLSLLLLTDITLYYPCLPDAFLFSLCYLSYEDDQLLPPLPSLL